MGGHRGHRKDEILDALAREANVAQFVSFGPDLVQSHSRVRGFPPDHRFAAPEEAVAVLLDRTPERSVNIRSYDPDSPKSREFLYGRTDAAEVLDELRRLSSEGLWTIVNETIDVRDGGVSGVAFGDLLEFAPGDTPRCVEKPGTAALPRELGLRLLETVYGFRPSLPNRPELRVELTIHPQRRGYRHEHTVLWEIEEPGPPPDGTVLPSWPNHFSRHLGDKAFGLLIADAYGLLVPRTLVIPRALAPFSFGSDTGSAETWIRTCPREQMPGLFTTRRGWVDPFALLNKEDLEGTALASVLCQQAVEARWSGALLSSPDGEPLVEGVSGTGDDFMTGRRPPEDLPGEVERAVRETFEQARGLLGPVRFEWAWDGGAVWILQLHRGASAAGGRVIVPGEAVRYHSLHVSEGIEALRTLITRVQGTSEGIVLVGRVGVTSHLGDLLRRARIPSRIEEREDGRNGAIPDEMLDRLLVRHRALHPLDKPLVEADFRHALDVWQWVLRLDPEAGGAVQIAALFHDVERLFTEAELRSEQTVADYDDYKARHAARSAVITDRVLEEEGCDPALRARAVALIAGHDQPGRVDSAEAALLEDADALSFFSLNSSGYLAYYGEEQARRKVQWTFARLSRKGRERLARLRLPPEVAVLLPPTLRAAL